MSSTHLCRKNPHSYLIFINNTYVYENTESEKAIKLNRNKELVYYDIETHDDRYLFCLL